MPGSGGCGETPRRVELDVERGAENQRLADAITKTGDLGPLPIYVGEAAHGREKGRDEIVDLFRRVAAHGEDVAERLHSALKGHVDPDLHRTLYAESQIPEPDGGKDGDDEEENPGTPQTPPTKPGDPKNPDDPNQPEKPDEGDKEDEEKEKTCAELREELRVLRIERDVTAKSLTKASDDIQKAMPARDAAWDRFLGEVARFAIELVVPRKKLEAAIRAGKTTLRVRRRNSTDLIEWDLLPIPFDAIDAWSAYREVEEKVESLKRVFEALDADLTEIKSKITALEDQMDRAECG